MTARDGGGGPAHGRQLVDSAYPTIAREGPAETVEVGSGDLDPGTVLGKYRVVRRIAGGGMGAVYEAIHTGINKPVALKTMSPTLASDPRFATRFLREAAAASRLDHPHVVDVTDFGTDGGVSYLVMELLRGQDLASLLAREANGLEPSLVADVLLAVCAGVFAAHESGVVHRDLKPQNIFLARTPLGEVVPKVLDFGISKRLDDDLDAGLTSSGAVMGTTHYLSPEQVSGRPLDVRSDQYSLGVILYECLTGRRPHEGDSMFAVMQSIGAGRFPLPRLVRPEIPPALEAVILKAMSSLPQDRFESVHELGASLMAFASPKRRIMWADYYQRGRPPVTPAPGGLARSPLPAVAGQEGGTVALDLRNTPLTPTQTRTPARDARQWNAAGDDTRSEPGPVPVLGTDEFLRTWPSRGRRVRRGLAMVTLLAGATMAYALWTRPEWLTRGLERLPPDLRDGVRQGVERALPPGPSPERAPPPAVVPVAAAPAPAGGSSPAPPATPTTPAATAGSPEPAPALVDHQAGVSPAAAEEAPAPTSPPPAAVGAPTRRGRPASGAHKAAPPAQSAAAIARRKMEAAAAERAAAMAIAAARKRGVSPSRPFVVPSQSPPPSIAAPARPPLRPVPMTDSPAVTPPPVEAPAPAPARPAPINPTGAPIIE